MALFFVFPKILVPMEIVFLTYNKPMINQLISRRGTPLPTILPSNKIHHKASPEAYGALEQSSLNRGSTSFLELSNKIHPLFDIWVTFGRVKCSVFMWYKSSFCCLEGKVRSCWSFRFSLNCTLSDMFCNKSPLTGFCILLVSEITLLVYLVSQLMV